MNTPPHCEQLNQTTSRAGPRGKFRSEHCGMEARMTGGGSQDQVNGESDSHVIRVTSRCSSSMELRFKQWPNLLKPSAANYSCCIFKAPRSLVHINEKAYEPQIVSIGPYHHGREQLNMVEQHKPRFLSALLKRTSDGGVGLDAYFKAIALREDDIRDCYSELLLCESSALVEMMVLDACFIIEVLRTWGPIIQPDPDDPFFSMTWIVSFLLKDLLRIENQIPFFVLQVVFDLSKGDAVNNANTPSLNELALGFFNLAAQRPKKKLEEFYQVSDVKHLLDLFRLSFIGHLGLERPGDVDDVYVQLIPSATQLLRSGIKCEPRKDNNFNLIDIQFDHGVLRIPPLNLDDFISSFLLNSVAFEQCYIYCSRHMTSYIAFMRCLVNTEKDVELLFENQLLVNYMGSNAEVVTFFNDLGKDTAFDIKNSYLSGLFGKVNKRHQNKRNLHWAGIKREYFGSPWSFISAVAATVLLVLTVIQAFYAIYAYYRPPK